MEAYVLPHWFTHSHMAIVLGVGCVLNLFVYVISMQEEDYSRGEKTAILFLVLTPYMLLWLGVLMLLQRVIDRKQDNF